VPAFEIRTLNGEAKSMNQKYLVALLAFAVLALGVYALRDTFVPEAAAPAAQPSQVVELKNGDTYALTAAFIEKKIGTKIFRMLAYNGSIPGPLLKAPQGAEVTINFTNNTDIDTTLHSHGLRLENRFDGTPGLTQDPIKPGATFTYKLKFPDAGMYWYHPHEREDYAQELGLYGNYLVTPTNDKYWSPVNREVPLFLDDILIENGEIPLSKTQADHLVMGRFGNVMLVNGETDYTLSVKKGEVVRFYVTNAANVRPFNFRISGAKMKLVGADGGAYEHDEWSDGVILAPSERVVVEVLFATSGTFTIENKTPAKTYALGTIVVSDETVSTPYASEFEVLKTHDDTVSSIDPFRSSFLRTPDKTLALALGMNHGMMGGSSQMGRAGGMMGGPGGMSGNGMMSAAPATGAQGSSSPDGIEWEDNAPAMSAMMDRGGMMQWQILDDATGKTNMAIDWRFHVGDKVKIRIVNSADSMHAMQHPIHFHGQRFLVLAEDGKENTNLVWKDTVLVPAGRTTDILLDASNPGTWMAHCHIAEHLEDGMMFSYSVQ